MLTNELRPRIWSDVAGQKDNIKVLKAIVRNPEQSPKTLILEGFHGCGKTTCARILARELNGIKDINYDLFMSPFYYEYDATVIGNVQDIKRLRDTFGVSYGDYWKVIVLDEVHAVSQQAQTALLKVLEEVASKTIFCLCTTHIHKVLPTIRSRSLELSFGTIPYDDVLEHLSVVENKLKIELPEDIKDRIASRSLGHMRNAHMLLDKYLLVGAKDFRESIVSSITLICDFFKAVKDDNVQEIITIANKLLNVPVEYVRNDFSTFILEGLKCLSGVPIKNKTIEDVISIYKSNFMSVTNMFFSDWFKHAFDDSVHLQCALLVLYQRMKAIPTLTSSGSSPNSVGNSSSVRRTNMVRKA